MASRFRCLSALRPEAVGAWAGPGVETLRGSGRGGLPGVSKGAPWAETPGWAALL